MLFSQQKSGWKVRYKWLKGDCMNDRYHIVAFQIHSEEFVHVIVCNLNAVKVKWVKILYQNKWYIL